MGVRRDIYTYLRFELRVEVWVGREMGDGRWETGKKKKREKEVMERMEFDRSRCLSLSPSPSLSLCYDMLYRLLYNVIHYSLISHFSSIPSHPFPPPPNLHPHPHPHLFPLLPILPNHIRRLLRNSIQRTTQMRTQLNRHHTRIHDSHILRPIDL